MTKASDNAFPSILITEGTEPSAPAAGKQRLYIDSTSHHVKRTDSSGTDVDIEGISNPMTTSGDIIYGGASGTPTRLAKGSDGQILTLASGLPSWAAASSSAAGYAPFAAQWGVSNQSAFAASRSLAAVSGGNGGACGALIVVPAPMKLRSISVWNKNTASARSAECRLYSVGTSASAAFVTGTDGTWSFTASANSIKSATVSGAPVTLSPGYYLAVVRNTHASNTFDVGTDAVATPNFLGGGSVHSITASIAALGSTIDVTAWTRSASGIGISLDGEIFGTGAVWGP